VGSRHLEHARDAGVAVRRTWAAWQENWGATHAATPTSPMQLTPWSAGGAGGIPEAAPEQQLAALRRSRELGDRDRGLGRSRDVCLAPTSWMSSGAASSASAASARSCSATWRAPADDARPLLNVVWDPVAPMSYGPASVSWQSR